MTSQVWWFLSRGSGIVAWMMIATTSVWGIVMMTRLFNSTRPAWMLDLHRWLGALAVITTIVHVCALVPDNYVHFGWTEILVPQGSAWKTSAVTWGVVGFYVLIVIEGSSLMMKRLPRGVWHSIHLLSYVSFAFVTIHAALAGTDRANRVYVGAVLLVVSAVVIGIAARVVNARHRGGEAVSRGRSRSTA